MKTTNDSASRVRRVLVWIEHTPFATNAHIKGIHRYRRTRKANWTVILRETIPEDTGGLDLSDGNFDGIISGTVFCNPKLFRSLTVPTVSLIGGIQPLKIPKRMPWHATLFVDNQTIVECAVAYLLERGFTSFAYVGILPDELASRERSSALMRCVSVRQGLGVQIYPASSGAAVRDAIVEEKRLAAWLKTLPRKTAVIAGNDARAETVLGACQRAGLRVPDDLAVMGIDNDAERCQVNTPSLTSVAVAFEEAGYRAAELLDGYFNSLPRDCDVSTPRPAFITESYASPTVISRESTDERLSSDALVCRALELINAAQGCHLTVKSLLDQLKVSETSLTSHFRAALGRSPLAEIARVKLACIKSLLRDPAVTRSALVERCGFSDTAHLAYFFRRHTGMTIAAYRATLQTTQQESR